MYNISIYCFSSEVGDWSARIWADDIHDSSIFWVNSGTEPLNDGCWSPTRPSMFFLARNDGWVEGWDIIDKQSGPVVAKEVHSGPTHCLAPHSGGSLLCVGCHDGGIALLQLSRDLTECTKVNLIIICILLLFSNTNLLYYAG